MECIHWPQLHVLPLPWVFWRPVAAPLARVKPVAAPLARVKPSPAHKTSFAKLCFRCAAWAPAKVEAACKWLGSNPQRQVRELRRPPLAPFVWSETGDRATRQRRLRVKRPRSLSQPRRVGLICSKGEHPLQALHENTVKRDQTESLQACVW